MSAAPVRLFIGSSSEGLNVARNLEAELEAMKVCDVERWDRDVFEPSGYTLDSLLAVAAQVDFAVLIASPDDVVESRGVSTPTARDNVLLEFGMFLGALGRQRTFLLATGDLKLPSDVVGLTRLAYSARGDGNVRKALNSTVLQLDQRVRQLGHRRAADPASEGPAPGGDALERELALLCDNARSQGWTVKSNNDTTLRLRDRKGRPHSMQKSTPEATRQELRRFAAELRAAGLRVNSAVRRPTETSPCSAGMSPCMAAMTALPNRGTALQLGLHREHLPS